MGGWGCPGSFSGLASIPILTKGASSFTAGGGAVSLSSCRHTCRQEALRFCFFFSFEGRGVPALSEAFEAPRRPAAPMNKVGAPLRSHLLLNHFFPAPIRPLMRQKKTSREAAGNFFFLPSLSEISLHNCYTFADKVQGIWGGLFFFQLRHQLNHVSLAPSPRTDSPRDKPRAGRN